VHFNKLRAWQTQGRSAQAPAAMADSSAVAQSDEERVLGPPIASLVRAGLIIPGLGRHADQSRDTLLGYARTLPAAELAPLYACPWCTQSMVQGLEATSRQ